MGHNLGYPGRGYTACAKTPLPPSSSPCRSVTGDLLYPHDTALRREVDELEEQFDTQLGPHTRRWAYQQLLPVLFPAECRAVLPALDSAPHPMREEVVRELDPARTPQ